MKKLTIILIIAAAAGGTAWIFGTKKGRELLEDFNDKIDQNAARLKSHLHNAGEATAAIIEKSKNYLKSNHTVREKVS